MDPWRYLRTESPEELCSIVAYVVVCIYIYICMYTRAYTYIYIYVYIQSKRIRENTNLDGG